MIIIDNILYYGIIYKIECNINNKIYIGQTSIGFDERYKGDLEKYTHNLELKKDIKRYGMDNFNITKVLDKAETKNELDEKEVYWIDYFNSYIDGYNKNIGGTGSIQENKSIILKTCELWNENPLYTIKDMSLSLNINEVSIRRILKIGKELKICNYDVNECDKRKSYEYIKKYKKNEVIDLWNKGEKTPREIGKELNIFATNFIIKMLKEGNTEGLCNYSSDESNKRIESRKRKDTINKKMVIKLWNKGLTTNEISDELKLKKTDVLDVLKNAKEEGLCDYTYQLALKRGNEKRKFEYLQKKDNNKTEVIKLWNEGRGKQYIMRVLKLSNKMVTEILKEGTEENLCEYSIELATKRGRETRGE